MCIAACNISQGSWSRYSAMSPVGLRYNQPSQRESSRRHLPQYTCITPTSCTQPRPWLVGTTLTFDLVLTDCYVSPTKFSSSLLLCDFVDIEALLNACWVKYWPWPCTVWRRSGNERVKLQDEDQHTMRQYNGYKQLNTLATYGLRDGAVLALVTRTEPDDMVTGRHGRLHANVD